MKKEVKRAQQLLLSQTPFESNKKSEIHEPEYDGRNNTRMCRGERGCRRRKPFPQLDQKKVHFRRSHLRPPTHVVIRERWRRGEGFCCKGLLFTMRGGSTDFSFLSSSSEMQKKHVGEKSENLVS